MDKSWISSNRLTNAYDEGVEDFLTFAQNNNVKSDISNINVLHFFYMMLLDEMECSGIYVFLYFCIMRKRVS